MALRTVAVQMDDIAGIDTRGDTTFALLLEAQARGLQIFCYGPGALTLEAGRIQARGQWLTVQDTPGAHFQSQKIATIDLSTVDCVLLRQDPPFDMAYITTTHILELLAPHTLVVNDPVHVRNCPEKLFVLQFEQFMPPTLITREQADVRAFHARHGQIIIKPLYGNGGAGIFKVGSDGLNLNALLETFQATSREPFMVQEFRPEVAHGDRRVIYIDGEIAGAINRVPQAGETRSNMHVGGRAEPSDITAQDREIAEVLGPELHRRGLVLTGIDMIGSYLTEINVTSPTGVRELKRFSDVDAAGLFWDAVEKRSAQ